MRKNCIIFLLSIIITLTALGFSGVSFGGESSSGVGAEYLRIHIRADSNEESAQAVKYKVRDDIVEYLTPIVASCTDKEKAMQAVNSHLEALAQVATATLSKHGFSYQATAALSVESFPTRVYENCTLPAGEYTALIVKLGRGAGDNWWCVVYPPLCFVGTENVVYKSKIVEIIQKFKARQNT